MGLRRHAGSVSGATMLSRIFGLIRDQLFAATLGAGFFADAFVVAFRIPNLLRDLFAEGALSHAFVPTLTEYRENHSQQQAWQLANLVLGTVLLLMAALVLLGIVLAPHLVNAIAPGFADIPGKSALTVTLTRIMFPFLLVVTVAALFMGVLNVHNHFIVPALAPVTFNVVSIGFGLAAWLLGLAPTSAVIMWAIGTLLGGVAQAIIQIPALVKYGWRPRPSLHQLTSHLGLRHIGLLMLPAIIASSGTQVNVLVNTILASLLEEGSPSWLNYAFRLMQLPIGVFGVAIAVVTLALVAKEAAHNNLVEVRSRLTDALSLVCLLTLPCAVGLWVLGEPIIRLIYQRGAFSAYDTQATYQALSYFAIGLPAYAAVKVQAPIFFALKNSKIPMLASLTGIAVNIIINLAVYRTMGHRGLALGTAIGMIVNVSILNVVFQLKFQGVMWLRFITVLWKTVVATTVMALIAHYLYQQLHVPHASVTMQLFETLITIAGASTAYVTCLIALRVSEVKTLLNKWRR